MATKGKKAFKPLLVWYDEELHLRAEKQAESKLKLLDEASVWVYNTLDLSDDKKINLKRLHLNMVEYFKDLILYKYKDVNMLGLSASKLIEAKEIDLKPLMEIQKQYESIELATDITFPEGIPMIEVNKKDYEIWTTSEKQNEKVILGNQFIHSANELSKIGVKVYPANISRATSNFVLYDLAKNKYILNRQELFS